MNEYRSHSKILRKIFFNSVKINIPNKYKIDANSIKI